jgi:hypothetical protein
MMAEKKQSPAVSGRAGSSLGLPLLAFLLAFGGVLPFVILGLHAHPSADDWYMAADTLEKGFWRSNVDFYLGLTGRFFSSALLFMNPMLVSFTAYKSSSMLLVMALPVSAYWAVTAWFPQATRAWCWLLAIMASMVFFWGMASPAQGLYWATGSVGYTLPGVLSLGLASLLGRRCLEPGWRPPPVFLVLLAVLALAITGCTEVSMALFLAHVTALNAIFFWLHRIVSRPLLVVLLAAGAGAAAMVLTPGNANREAWYVNDIHHAPLPALVMALKLAVRQVAVWGVYTPLALFSLLILWLGVPGSGVPARRAWQLVILALVLIAVGIFGGFFLGTWSMGAVIPLRAVNLMLLFFLIDWILLLAGVSALLRPVMPRLPQAGWSVLVGVLIFLGLSAAVLKNNIKNAWGDLLSGQAALFDQENWERHALIESSSLPDVSVPPLTARPATLFFNDLTSDPANWRNTGCARFFRKRSLTLEHPTL